MSSLFRRPLPGKVPARYVPDPDQVWGRSFLLRPEPGREGFDLGRACEVFGLEGDHPDRLTLRFDDTLRQAVLVFGPHSEVRSAALAPYEAFTSVDLLRYEYLHERDWPAEDETVVGVRLKLRAGKRTLLLQAGDYAKFQSAWQQRSFVGDVEELAARMDCPCRVRHSRRRPG